MEDELIDFKTKLSMGEMKVEKTNRNFRDGTSQWTASLSGTQKQLELKSDSGR
jgi:hypothetical protein